jgi:hypothetical protein
MAKADITELRTCIGSDAVDESGDKIGSIEDLYLDNASGEPEWFAIKTGLFGTSQSFAPVRGYRLEGEEVRLPYAKDMVKDAPSVDPEDGRLDSDEERRLYDHYSMSWSPDIAPGPSHLGAITGVNHVMGQ